jgi:integrase
VEAAPIQRHLEAPVRERKSQHVGCDEPHVGVEPDAYVFSADEAGHRPLRVDTMTRRFGELAEDLGHGYTLYGFRHFMATQLGAVATTATIRERMGHRSLEVTGGYVHRVSETDREAAQHMAELFDRQGRPS